MSRRLWSSLIRAAVPEHIDELGPDARRRAEFTVAAASLASAVTLTRGIILIARGPTSQGMVALAVAATCLGCLVLLRRTASLHLVGNVLAGTFFLALSVLIFRRGGLDSPPTIALGLVPLLSVLIAGWRSGVVWAAAGILELAGYAIVDPDLPDLFSPDRHRSLGFLGAVTMILLSLGISAAYEATKNAAITARDDAERRRKRLAEERAQLSADLERAGEEMRAQRAQRLASLGELAAGISHDFNNLLVAIINFSQLAEDELDRSPSQARAYLAEVRSAAHRSAMLTRQLLSFAKRQDVRQVKLDTLGLIEDFMRMLRRLVPESIDIVAELDRNTRPVLADRAQVEQLLMNLCINARDAMPDGGRLTIGASNVTLDDSKAERLGIAPGEYVALHVSDTGSGILEDVRARIFEPFFSTKDQLGGTGLGLSMVSSIVRQHGGAVDLDSTPGRGSTFCAYLPVATSVTLPPESEAPRPSRASTAGTILLVEDDAQVRRLANRVLEGAGFRVLVAEDGQQALELFESNRGVVDLVLSDVVMPRMGGKELHDRVSALAPDLPFLFCSGYTDTPFPQGFFDAPHRKMLSKPYVATDLVDEVQKLLTAVGRAEHAATA